jgi:hypothetical protein
MRRCIRELIKDKKVNASGIARDVYYLSEHQVLKVAKSEHGIESIKNEVNIYKSCPSSIRKHLSKIIKNGRSWIIMKRYDREFPNSKIYKRKLLELESEFLKHGIIASNTSRRNLRLNSRGRIIVIDYGNFNYK